MKKMNEKGFTLVELIVVMAVLAVISAIAVPRFLGVQEDAKVEADYATAAMLGKAAELYLVEDSNLISALNDATSVEILQGLLKTTKIDFVSKDFNGNEGTIEFTEGTNGEVIVEATNVTTTAVDQMYPR
ncbi:MAG: Tfp pilus assembly protein PilE-like protein [Sedimentibacter sp.]|nr:Tfp pilus assembly protein PilE-like protein [Sedimentibacter sp.]